MHALTEVFMDSVRVLAKEDGYENAVNFLEVLVLANFVVTEIYLGLFRDRAFAADVLDQFHHFAAESLFNGNLSSFQDKFPDNNVGAMYDQFMRSFHDKTRERYAEYRGIMLDAKGLFRFSEQEFNDLGKHLLNPSSNVHGEHGKPITVSFGLAVVEHMFSCIKSLKR